MRSQFGRWSLTLIGLGVGIGIGWAIPRPAPIVAVIAVVAGLMVAIAGAWQADRSSPESTARRTEQKAQRAELRHARRMAAASAPTLTGLGGRVEQILRLAEEQAEGHRRKAKQDADQILAAARREAEAIMSSAQAVRAEVDSHHTLTPASSNDALPSVPPDRG